MGVSFLHDPTVWVLFSFLIFIGLAWAFGRKTVLSMLDTRIEAIRDELRSAETLRIEAQELLAQYQRKFRDAAKEADAIVTQAREHAARIRARADADLSEAVRRKEALLETRLKRLEESAIQDLRAQATRLAVEAAERMLREKVDDRANAALVESSLADLSRHLSH